MLSQKTITLLHEAGWYPTRKVDTSAWEELLQSKGYKFFSAVRKALEQYGGLRIINRDFVPPAPEDLHFVVEDAVDNATPEKVKLYYSKRVGKDRCVIGEAYQGHLLLMMDNAGFVYGGYDEEFFNLGDSIDSSIEGMVKGTTFAPVAE